MKLNVETSMWEYDARILLARLTDLRLGLSSFQAEAAGRPTARVPDRDLGDRSRFEVGRFVRRDRSEYRQGSSIDGRTDRCGRSTGHRSAAEEAPAELF